MELGSFKHYLEGDCYTRQEEVSFSDCDRTQRMKISALLGRVAIYGAYDYNARGITQKRMMEDHQVFMFSRAVIHIHDCPRCEEVLTLSTWETGITGPCVDRYCEGVDSQGRVRVSSKAEWLIVDPEARKILRPSEFKAKKVGTYPKDVDCPRPQKIVLPEQGIEKLGTRRIVWSDLDVNGHMFSGKYGEVIWDALPEDLQDAPVKVFHINYNREALPGQTLELVGCRQGNKYYMEGRGPERSCFAALCEFAEE